MKFSRRDVLRRVSIFSVEDFEYCHKSGITWIPFQNCLDFKVLALIGIFFVQTILKDKPLTSYAFSVYVCMKTNLLLYTKNERYQATGKSRRRIFKDIYLSEYMTIACVRHLTLTMEQKYLVSYNYYAFALWQLKNSTTKLTNKRKSNG
jgi:hypothetical protein